MHSKQFTVVLCNNAGSTNDDIHIVLSDLLCEIELQVLMHVIESAYHIVPLNFTQATTTALHVAAISGQSLAVEILVQAGAHVNCKKYTLKVSLLYCD